MTLFSPEIYTSIQKTSPFVRSSTDRQKTAAFFFFQNFDFQIDIFIQLFEERKNEEIQNIKYRRQ